MFGIGMTELMVIFVIGLVVLGPKRLPEMARSLGRTLAEFRRASNDMRREFMEVSEEARIDPPSLEPPPPPPKKEVSDEATATPVAAGETGTAPTPVTAGETGTAPTPVTAGETGTAPTPGATGESGGAAPGPKRDG